MDFFNVSMPYTTVQPETLDGLLADGWRILSKGFVRHSHALADESELPNDDNWCRTIPVRIRLSNFRLSKSQRQLMRRNSDLHVNIQPIHVDADKHLLFNKHYLQRFKKLNAIHVFLRADSATSPCEGIEFNVWKDGRLIAYSTIHVGREGVSSTYAFYDPDESNRSLGVFTMLLEINYAQQNGKAFYYPGYVYDKPSKMDYKRNFFGIEYYNWKNKWTPFQRGTTPELPPEVFPEISISDKSQQ
jgi:arginine-tRNA-protein transferase